MSTGIGLLKEAEVIGAVSCKTSVAICDVSKIIDPCGASWEDGYNEENEVGEAGCAGDFAHSIGLWAFKSETELLVES